MSNFSIIYERMETDKKISKEEEEKLSLEAIEEGLRIDENFWKNFIMLLNNPESLSKLLGVSPLKISTWYSRIQKNLEKFLTNTDYDDIKALKKKKMVNTSDFDEFV